MAVKVGAATMLAPVAPGSGRRADFTVRPSAVSWMPNWYGLFSHPQPVDGQCAGQRLDDGKEAISVPRVIHRLWVTTGVCPRVIPKVGTVVNGGVDKGIERGGCGAVPSGPRSRVDSVSGAQKGLGSGELTLVTL